MPKAIRNPVDILRRQAFVFHCHDGDENGVINFRINFEHLTRVVRARVSEGKREEREREREREMYHFILLLVRSPSKILFMILFNSYAE